MNDLRKAADMALEALCLTNNEAVPDDIEERREAAIEALRQALAEDALTPCKTDPQAPHGFDRNASHAADRYVCECESWEPVDAVNMTQDRVDETAKGEHIIDCTNEQLIEEVRRRGFVIRDAQIGREWVGLTVNEVLELLPSSKWKAEETLLFVQRIEDELKEKNS